MQSNIWKFYAASILGGLAFFYNTVDTLYYRHFGLSFAQIGALIAATLLLAVVMEVPSGAFADLYGKRRALIVSLVGLISLPVLGALVDRLSLPTSLILLGV